MFLSRFFRHSPWKEVSAALYDRLVQQARAPVFYDSYGVADTVKGRSGMLNLHAMLLLNRLRRCDSQKREVLSQALFDTMFFDVENNLRELGYADSSLGKRVKGMIADFYGQVHAYESGLQHEDDTLLSESLARNLYYHTTDDADLSVFVKKMTSYVRQQVACLAAQDEASLFSGSAFFEMPVS